MGGGPFINVGKKFAFKCRALKNSIKCPIHYSSILFGFLNPVPPRRYGFWDVTGHIYDFLRGKP